MALDLTTSPPFTTATLVLGASDVATQVLLPKGSRRYTLKFVTNPGKIASTGTDGGAIAAGFYPLTAGCSFSGNTDHGARAGMDTDVISIFLAAAIGTTTVHILTEAGV